jgi:hypothetical protein
VAEVTGRGVMSGTRALWLMRSLHAVVSSVLLVSVFIASCVVSPIRVESSWSYLNRAFGELQAPAESLVTLIPSEEDTGSTHLNALGITTPIDESQSLQDRIDDVVAQGGIAIIDHPKFLCDVASMDLGCLTGYSGVEIYNAFVDVALRSEGYATDMLDAINTYRAEVGMDLIWGFAVDDAHRVEDLGRAWVVAKALHSDTDSVIASLRRGSFYSSTGAAIEDIKVVAHKEIVVTASEESTVTFIARGGMIVHRTDRPSSSASYRVQGDEGYVRVEVDSPSGRAWSQPMKVDSTGITHNPYAAKGRWLKGSIHCHTIESDGSCTPRQIIDWCTENGYRFLAITDHNKITVSS